MKEKCERAKFKKEKKKRNCNSGDGNLNSSDIERADSLRDDGESLRKNEQYQSAIPLLEESWKIYEKHGLSKENAQVPIHIGDCYMFLNMYDIALSKYKEAKKNAEENKLIGALATCYNKLGMIFLAQKPEIFSLGGNR